MPTIENNYLGNLRTEAKHLLSGERIITDAPEDNNGRGEAFSPTDLVSGALSSCMMTIIGIKSRQFGFDVSGLSSKVTKVMESDPRRISEIQIEMKWDDCPADEEQKEQLKNAARNCPVALSINPDIKQVVAFDFST